MMLRRLTILLLMPLVLFASVRAIVAQDEMPENLQVISSNNAEQIQQLSAIGGVLQGQLTWSPDGIHLAVGTSDNIQIYDSQNLANPPIVIDSSANFHFNEAGEIVADEQRWDIETGEFLGNVEQNEVNIEHPNFEISINRTDNENLLAITKIDDSTVTLNISNVYEFSGLLASPDEQFALLILETIVDGFRYEVIQLWNLSEGIFIADLPQRLELLDTVRFFADGDLIITASYTDAVYGNIFEEVLVWDGRTGELLNPEERNGLPIVYSPDGNLFAYVTWNGIALWKNREFDSELSYSEANINETRQTILFSPDSGTIATTYGQEIVLWETGIEQIPDIPRMIIPTETDISKLLYSSDGSYIVAIETNGIIEVWNAQTGEQQADLVASARINIYNSHPILNDNILHIRDVDGNAYTLDIKNNVSRRTELSRNASINNDWTQAAYWQGGTVRLVSLEIDQTSEIEVIENYLGGMISFSSDNGIAMFKGTSTSFEAYDVFTGEKYFEHAIPENSIYQVQFNDDGTQFMLINDSGSNNNENSIEIWDTENWTEPIASLTETGFWGYEFLYSPDNRYISELRGGACGGSGGGHFILRDGQTGEQVNFFYPGGLCGPYDHAFTPDSEWLLVAWDMVVHVNYVNDLLQENIDSEGYVPLSTGFYYNNYSYRVRQTTLSSDGETVAVHLIGVEGYETSLSPEPKIDIFRFADILATKDHIAEELVVYSIPNATQALFSPDNQWLLTDNGFWNAQTGEQVVTVFGTIAAFSPDSMILATYDSSQVTLWDVNDLVSGNENAIISFDIEAVQEIAFNPDGTLLFVKRAGDIQSWGILP